MNFAGFFVDCIDTNAFFFELCLFFSEECGCFEEWDAKIDIVGTELVISCLDECFFPFFEFKFYGEDGVLFVADDVCAAVSYFDFMVDRIAVTGEVVCHGVDEFEFIVEGVDWFGG